MENPNLKYNVSWDLLEILTLANRLREYLQLPPPPPPLVKTDGSKKPMSNRVNELQESRDRAAKDHGRNLSSKQATFFSRIVYCRAMEYN